jgi:phage-related baseplate assembly protein
MANHNQSSIPELPRRRGEVALEARQRFAAELQEAFTAAVAVLSRIPDAHYVPPAAEQPRQTVTVETPRQPQPSMTDRLRQTVTFNPTHTEDATLHPSDTQVAPADPEMNHAEYINNLVEQDEPDALVLQEQAKNEALDQVIAAYRNDVGLPQQAEGAITTELTMTPLERAERDFPNNDHYLVGDIDVTMSDIRDAVTGAYEATEEQQS